MLRALFYIAVVAIGLVIGIFFYNTYLYEDPTPTPPDDGVGTDREEITFDYPTELPTTYIRALDWPPQARVIDEPFTCTEAGEETARAGKTERRLVGGREFCVTTVTEGAAGSIYTQYAYVFVAEGKTVALTFSTQMPQCGNYDEAEKTACEAERRSFDLDTIVQGIADTIRLP